MKERVKRFEGVRNFRDFGGYQGEGGRQIRSGVLYRSAQFGEATQADLEALKTLSITVQADLRRPDERERHGHRWPGEAVQVLKSDKGRAKDAPHVRFLERAAVDADEARDWMVEYYRDAPYKEQHIDTFRAWFSALETLPDGQAAVVNCAAGKDRTGILCALTHTALGVDRETIMDDYLLTNEAADVATRLPEMARLFNQHIGKSYADAVYHPFVGVEPVFLNAAFDSIAQTSGRVEAYLADVLGVDDEAMQRLQDRYLV
ncbi:MAG: tyrosine-protein phosphatase [Pseudomonadota bacterium]